MFFPAFLNLAQEAAADLRLICKLFLVSRSVCFPHQLYALADRCHSSYSPSLKVLTLKFTIARTSSQLPT